MSHGAGGAARETRADRRSKGCCGARFGVATCIPLRPAICGPGQCANVIRLSKRGPPRCRIAGITPQISGCALVSECERRLLARLGHSKITDELGKSCHAADMAAMTEFDPNRTCPPTRRGAIGAPTRKG